MLKIFAKNNIQIIEKDISVTELYNADQVFTTGTMGELAKVIEIDKRSINDKGDLLLKLQVLFSELTKNEGVNLPF